MATYEITANGAPVARIEHNHPADAMDEYLRRLETMPGVVVRVGPASATYSADGSEAGQVELTARYPRPRLVRASAGPGEVRSLAAQAAIKARR